MGTLADFETSLSFTGKVAVTMPKVRLFSNDKQFGIGAVLIGHTCLLFGGYSRRKYKERIYIYDYVNKSWKTHQPKTNPDMYGRVRMCFLVNDQLYIYNFVRGNRRYSFSVLDVIDKEEWVDIGGEGCPQMGFGTSGSYVETRNEAVLYGGQSAASPTDLWVYKVDSSMWYSPRTTGEAPSPRYNHTTCCRGNNLFLLGGICNERQKPIEPLQVFVLNMQVNRFVWSLAETQGYAPPGRFLFHTVCTAGRIFVYGGYGGYPRFDVFSIRDQTWRQGVNTNKLDDEKVRFTSDWREGTSDHFTLLTSNKLLVIGGFRLSAAAPLEIVPS